jgi:hypothetical protein
MDERTNEELRRMEKEEGREEEEGELREQDRERD